MKQEERDRLLNDILAGEHLSDFRRSSLERALAEAGRCRRHRHTRRIYALAVLPLLTVIIVLFEFCPRPSVVPTVSFAPRAAATRKVQFITDEELFALFPGRQMALIGKPGQQRFVFLDKPAADGQP